jgi:hypothetical protein
MTALLWTLCVALFLFFIVSLCRLFLTFDSILKRCFRDHPEEWGRDGKATGFFWYPDGSGWLDGVLARGELLKSWRATVPSWAEGDQDLVALFGKLAARRRASNLAIGLYLVVLALAFCATYLRGILTST